MSKLGVKLALKGHWAPRKLRKLVHRQLSLGHVHTLLQDKHSFNEPKVKSEAPLGGGTFSMEW